MPAWRLPNLFIYTLAVLKPRSLRPDLYAKSIVEVDWYALRRKGFNAVVIDKDNCLTLPDRDDLYPEYKEGWERVKSAFGPMRVLVVSNSAGTKKDPGGIAAESVSRKLGVPVLIHPQSKPGCSKDILSYFSGETLLKTLRREPVYESDELRVHSIGVGRDGEGVKGEEEEMTLMGTPRRTARTASTVPKPSETNDEKQDSFLIKDDGKPDLRPVEASTVEPKFIVIGDRLSTDVLLARRLSKHLEPRREKYRRAVSDSELKAEQDGLPDGMDRVLSIVTTILPKEKDVRILRWLENRWARIGSGGKGKVVMDSKEDWTRFLIEDKPVVVEAGQQVDGSTMNVRDIVGIPKTSILTRIRSIFRRRTWPEVRYLLKSYALKGLTASWSSLKKGLVGLGRVVSSRVSGMVRRRKGTLPSS